MEMQMQISSNHRERSRPQRPPSPQAARSRPHRPPPPTIVAEIVDLSNLQACHDEAFKLTGQGLTCDEEGRQDEARSFYERGLHEVNRALAVVCENLQGTQEDRDSAVQLQQKMTKNKLQIQYRLESLKETTLAVPSAPLSDMCSADELPSYEEAVAGQSSLTDAQFSSLGDSIMTDSVDSRENSIVANATEIYKLPDGVQMFYITPAGYVSAPSYPSALKIFKFTERDRSASTSEQPPAFIQVGDWYYPLVPGTSPVLQSNYGAYLFPDITASDSGCAVGLTLPETVSAAERHQFEELLGSLTMMRQQEVVPDEGIQQQEGSADASRVKDPETQGAESTSTKISKGLIIAAEYISWGVGKSAEKAGELIKAGSVKLKQRINPEEAPRHVDPRLQKGIQYVRAGSHVAVAVSSFIVTKLGQATMALAREAAPHIRAQGEKLLPSSMKQPSKDGTSKMDGVIEVAASGLKGFGTVFMSLEAAAKVLGKNLANESADLVGHKYGSDAGQLTEHTLYSAGNIAMAAYNANHLGVKAIAKRAAKDTGKAVLQDIADKRKQNEPDGGGSSGAGKKGPPTI